MIIFICFPTQHNLVIRKHPTAVVAVVVVELVAVRVGIGFLLGVKTALVLAPASSSLLPFVVVAVVAVCCGLPSCYVHTRVGDTMPQCCFCSFRPGFLGLLACFVDSLLPGNTQHDTPPWAEFPIRLSRKQFEGGVIALTTKNGVLGGGGRILSRSLPRRIARRFVLHSLPPSSPSSRKLPQL